DYNRRVSRWASTFDGVLRNVAYTHGSAADGETGEYTYRWETLAAKHNRLHGDRPLSAQRLRKISYKLRDPGALEIEERHQGPHDRKPNAQRSNLFTIHVGLAIVQGQLVHHDFNQPLSDEVQASPTRPVCEVCGHEMTRRSDAMTCSDRCRKA